jgi:hypothetical protein
LNAGEEIDMKEDRRVLTAEEKAELRGKHSVCYICLNPLENYADNEIEYDHIYNYADGYPQELSNFAPVHASHDPNKANCHKSKGKKSPVDYREELRILKALKRITGLKDLCPKAVPSVYSLSERFDTITINGTTLPVYNQRIAGRDNHYFFHEVETKYIENDDEIQLRPLEPKIVPLVFNLKRSVQLLPTLGRLDAESKTIKVFDGQHKAVAQIVGNNRTTIPCIVFVHPPVAEIRVVIYEAHTDFVQQRYKKSHIDAKLADIYRQKIEAYRKQVGDQNARFTEADILRGESRAEVRKFLMASIIDEIKLERSFVREYAAEDRQSQKRKPILWQSLGRLIGKFCKLDAISKYSDDPENYRSDEVENVCFILDQIELLAIKDKWSPDNSDSHLHKLSRTFFYKTAFNTWIDVLEEALKFALEQKNGAKIYEPLCFQKAFSSEIKARFIQIMRKMFDHPLWVQEPIQDEIAKANQDVVVSNIFKRENLDYIYLTKL